MGRPPVGRNIDSRTRLLNSLGLFQEEQQRDEGRKHVRSFKSKSEERDVTSSSQSQTWRGGKIRHVRSLSDIPMRSALHNTEAFETRLNDESFTRDRRSDSRRRSLSSGKERKNDTPGSVRFNTVVSGVKIPSRNQYSRRIRQTLWRDRYEISEMVERNTAEFHAENYDWNQVVLDDDMYIDAISGERVHPCHVEGNSFDSEYESDEESFGDLAGFAPLARSDSLVGEKMRGEN